MLNVPNSEVIREIIASFCLSFAVGVVAIWVVLRLLRDRVLDVPNERSSHTVPTPRGGGIGIFLATIVALFAFWRFQLPAVVVVLPAVIVTIVSAWDDIKSLSARARLLVQVLAAASFLGVVFYRYHQADIFHAAPFYNQLLVYLFFILFLLWFSNLYNFMDGSDGLVGTQVVTTLVPAIILIWRLGYANEAYLLTPLLGAYSAFLLFNWNPAKIFMGDVGSVFTGFFIGEIAILLGAAYEPKIFWAIGTLSCGFIVDATFTLLVRLLRRERVWEAHRTHAFQKLLRCGWSHKKVALFYGALNLFWITPVVLVLSDISLYLMVLLAGLPHLCLALKLRAGTDWLPSQSQLSATPRTR